MRIAVLTNDYPPVIRGGAGRIADLQVRALTSAGETVRVWQRAAPWFGKSLLQRLAHHLFDLNPRLDLVREMVAWKPDVLLTHNVTGCGFSTPRLVQRLSRARWVHTLHDAQLFEPSGQWVYEREITWWQRLWALLRRLHFGAPDAVISPTRWLLEAHQRRGFFLKTANEILPNPGPNPHLRRVRESRAPHTPLRLLFIGRVSKDKGTDLLSFLAKNLSVELHVVGDGPCLREIRDVSAGVICYGALTPDLVEAQLKATDILLVPSQILENQPTVILEAAAFGIPVIASRLGGIPETMDGAGVLCDPKNGAEWVRAVLALTEKEAYLSTSEAMERVAKRHDPAVYLQRLIGVLGSKR